MNLDAFSHSRHNAGVMFKRLFGSSTATVFGVFEAGGRTLYVMAYGATPAERKAVAIRAAEPYFNGAKPWPIRNDGDFGHIKARPEQVLSTATQKDLVNLARYIG